MNQNDFSFFQLFNAGQVTTSNQESPAIWMKLDPVSPNSDEIISHGDLVITEDPRFRVQYYVDTNTFVLVVSDYKDPHFRVQYYVRWHQPHGI